MRKNELYAAMKKASRAVKSNCFFPNAGMMLVKLKDGRLSIAARNSNEHLLVTTEADGKEINCIVNAATFVQVINKMPAEEVQLSVSKGKLMVTSKNMKVGVPAADGKEWLYPNRFEVEAENELSRDILKTSHALAKTGGNSLMESYHLEISEVGFKVTALDGHRISIFGKTENALCQDIVLEGKLIQDAFALTDGKVVLQTDGEDIRLIGNAFILSGKTRPERYFRIDQIIDSVCKYNCEAEIDISELKGALEVSTIIEPVTILVPKDDVLEIRPKASNDGEGVFSVPAKVTGQIDGKAALNGKYLIDALASLEAERTKIRFISFNKTYAISIVEGEQLEFIMPVMIR